MIKVNEEAFNNMKAVCDSLESYHSLLPPDVLNAKLRYLNGPPIEIIEVPNPEQHDLVELFVSQLRELCEDTTTSFELVITADTYRVSQTNTPPAILAKRGASMRNLRGDWIK